MAWQHADSAFSSLAGQVSAGGLAFTAEISPGGMESLQSQLDGFSASRVQVMARRAIDKALVSLRVRIGQRLREILPTLKARTVREGILAIKSRHSGLFDGRPTGRLRLTGRRIPLIDLGAVQTPVGVAWRSSIGSSEIPSAFITRIGGRPRAMHRLRVGGRRVGRLPIGELKGPSIMVLFERSEGIVSETLTEAGELLDHYLRQQIDLARQGQAGYGGIDEAPEPAAGEDAA